MRQRSERLLHILLYFLLSVLDDLRGLTDQNTIFRVKTSNPGCVVAVPSVVIRGYNLFDLLFAGLIDSLGRCRGGEPDSDNR
jgi:hypothetical protein